MRMFPNLLFKRYASEKKEIYLSKNFTIKNSIYKKEVLVAISILDFKVYVLKICTKRNPSR